MIAVTLKFAPQPRTTRASEVSFFLMDCVRHFLRPTEALRAPFGLDWTSFIALAKEHSVEPVVYAALQRDSFSAVPPAVLSQLHKNIREMTVINSVLATELARILALLKNAGIDVICFKGPVLAETLYEDLTMRSFSDLDLLIHAQDFLQTKSTLEASGYSLGSSLHWPSDSACLRARDCQLSFENSRGVSADVHWRLLPGYLPLPFNEAEVWQGRLGVPLGGATAWTLSRERLLLFLCAHGGQHLWARLGWICDVARLIQVETKMNWPYVFAQASQTSTSRMLSLGLILAADLIGDDLPPRAKERVVSDFRAQELAIAVRKRFLDCAPMPARAFEAASLSVQTLECTGHRMRYLFGSILGPSEAEYRALPLPPALFSLYYPFRPLRLCGKYLGRVLADIGRLWTRP